MNGELNKYYYNRRFKDLKEIFNVKISSIEKAIELAHEEMERRLQGMNEFREQLNNQAHEFITRKEMDIIKAKISELKEFKATLEGKADHRAVSIAYIISFLGIIIGVIAVVISLVK